MGVAPGVSPHRVSPRRDPTGIPPPDGSRASSSSEGLTWRPSIGCHPVGISSEISTGNTHRRALPGRLLGAFPGGSLSGAAGTPPRRSIFPPGSPRRSRRGQCSRVSPGSFPPRRVRPGGLPAEGPRELLLGGAIDTPLHQVPPRQLLPGGVTAERGPSRLSPGLSGVRRECPSQGLHPAFSPWEVLPCGGSSEPLFWDDLSEGASELLLGGCPGSSLVGEHLQPGSSEPDTRALQGELAR